MQITKEFYDNFFNDFFFYYTNEKSDVVVNKSVNFISGSIDPLKTTSTSVKDFLYNLFFDILTEQLTPYEKEYLLIEKDVKISLFKSEHFIMPECFINVLDFCSRDEVYEKLKYTLINFMYSIINGV